MVNIDLSFFPEVDIIADITNLPFVDQSLDFIIFDAVLEHVKYPYQIVEEARRALKPGGLLYLAVPFVHPYHGYPADYHRFSLESLKLLTVGFEPLEMGVLRGPMVALLNCLTDFPFLLTFAKSPRIYLASKGLAILLCFWLKYLDKLLVKNSQSHRLAHSVYFLGKKAADACAAS